MKEGTPPKILLRTAAAGHGGSFARNACFPRGSSADRCTHSSATPVDVPPLAGLPNFEESILVSRR